MKVHPIIFSGPMVRSLNDGRKTQTRRVFKFPKWADPEAGLERSGRLVDPGVRNPSPVGALCEETGCFADVPCPYGTPGDLLWVRETTYKWNGSGTGKSRIYCADGAWIDWGQSPVWHGTCDLDSFFGAKTPSIHMPCWASRITLQLTDVRVERVQEISERDARAEGVELPGIAHPGHRNHRMDCLNPESYTQSFATLWDSLNAKRGYSWESNPWVWALTFTVHQRNVDDNEHAGGSRDG